MFIGRSDQATRSGFGSSRRWGGRGRRIPFYLLLLSLLVSGIGAYQAFETERDQQTIVEDVLAYYGASVAFNVSMVWEQTFGPTISSRLVEAGQIVATGRSTEQCLEVLLDPYYSTQSCPYCGIPEIAANYAFHIPLTRPTAIHATAGARPPEPELARVLEAVEAHARTKFLPSRPFNLMFLEGEGAEAERAILYNRVSLLSDTFVVGFEVDRDALRDSYRYTLQSQHILPSTLTKERPIWGVMAVRVESPGGEPVFQSVPDVGSEIFEQGGGVHASGGMNVKAAVLPEAVESLIIGGIPETRLPYYLMIFGLAGTLALVALFQLQKEEELALLRSDFVASVSHELRTPLAQIRLFIETLRLGRVRNDDEREWSLESIDRETRRLGHLVENVLQFSRAERNLLDIEVEPSTLAEEVHEGVRDFAQLIAPHRSTFETDIPPDLPIAVHKDSFRQVLMNLLDNAVKYGREGQVVRVTGRSVDGEVELTVDDEGPGVASDDRERIWAPFRRGANAVGSVASGSGIGLAIVREIVTAHNGTIRVDQAPGGGARFVLRLPSPISGGPSESPDSSDSTAVRA